VVSDESIDLEVRLHPPLSNTVRQERIKLTLVKDSTLQSVIDGLTERFGSQFRRHLYDDRNQFIPAWVVFINGRPIHLNRPEALATSVNEGDSISFLLALAGG
jgi:molybdopterin converting factor small subunit